MKCKALELRDEGTMIPILAVDMQPGTDAGSDAFFAQHWLLDRVGYPCDGVPNILITKLAADGSKASNDPYFWGDRTFAVAHNYITENWHSLKDGDVVDVSFVLGETPTPKVSERRS